VSRTYSVVIPAYNAERSIEACLASVVGQTLAPLEVLVVDDASCDGTGEVIRRFEGRFAAAGVQLTYMRLDHNSGPSAARNQGIREAKGEYIAFLDADDRWIDEKLAVVDRFASGSTAGLVCHGHAVQRELRGDTQPRQYCAREVSVCEMLLGNPGQTSCAVVRKQQALAFDETMRYCEDYDLWMRIAEQSPVLRLMGDPLTCLGRPQLSAGGLSERTLQMRLGEFRVYFKFCRRSWLTRVWFLPGLLIFSVLKHAYSRLRRWLRPASDT
jgi:teichuronic acid biosynthesis glycosyltransferase TuaG